MDFVIEVNKMPLPGETVLGKSFSLVPGGKGANKAYALGKLGANVKMLGAVGDDDYGVKLLENLNSVNVDTTPVSILKNTNTGCAFINVDSSGENNIVVVSGANKLITEEIIYNNIKLIDESDIIVMQLEIPIEIVTLVAKIAHEKGKMVILDPAPADANLSIELLSYIDIIKPNQTELEILSGIKITCDEDIVSAAKNLIQKGVKNVIATLGEKGSVLVTENKIQKFSALDVIAIDSTAAGDSFTGALTKCLSEDKTIEEAIPFAHIVSSLAVTKKGAQTSIPSISEVEQFISLGDLKWKE